MLTTHPILCQGQERVGAVFLLPLSASMTYSGTAFFFYFFSSLALPWIECCEILSCCHHITRLTPERSANSWLFNFPLYIVQKVFVMMWQPVKFACLSSMLTNSRNEFSCWKLYNLDLVPQDIIVRNKFSALEIFIFLSTYKSTRLQETSCPELPVQGNVTPL
jgi:hypothetical protein